MPEIIDCSRGVSSDLDYILLGQKPPYYTEEEWCKKLNQDVDPKVKVENFKIIEDVFISMGIPKK